MALFAATLTLGLGAQSAVTRAATRAIASTAPEFYVEYFTVSYQSTLTIQTSGSAGATDPVLHLLRDNGDGTFTQMAYSDNWSGVEARISYTNASLAYSRFLLVLRAKTYAASGTCNLLKSGRSYRSGVPVGGNMVTASAFIFNTGDELRTVHVPGGSVAPALLKFSTSAGDMISGVGLGNGVGGSSVLSLAGTELHFLVGTPWLRDGAAYLTPRAGAANVMSNDVASDTDGDGIGNALEATLGLCAGTSGCPNAADGHGRDTDRDGLSDGEEVWGVGGTLTDGIDDLPFARWGANPKKKDVFLEVDYLTGIGGVLGTNTNPFQWLRDHPTGYLGNWQGSPEDWFDHASEPFEAGPNSHLHNPDSSDGVAIHLDVGVAPTNPANESEFGDWSSGSSRALVPDFIINVLDAIDGDVTVAINGVDATFDATGYTPADIGIILGFAVASTGEPVRLKSYTDNGDGTATTIFEAGEHGVHFTRALSVPSGYQDAVSTPGEDSVSLRAHYLNDADQVDVIRIGRVRYAATTGVYGGGQTGGAAFSAGLAHGAFIHELGHTLALEHWGHGQWGTFGPNCFPQYQSMMRYGGPPFRFSDTEGVDSLDAGAMPETETFGAGYDHSVYSPWPYYYTATSSTVDWNRDGSVSPSGTYWRTPGLTIYGSGYSSCGAFVQGRDRIVPSADVVGPVDLVRASTRLYAFWATGSTLEYKFATLGSQGDKSCTGTADPASGACLDWSSTFTLLSGSTYLGVSSLNFGGDLFLAYNNSSNGLVARKLTVNGNGTLTVAGTWSMLTANAEDRSAFAPELVEHHSARYTGAMVMLFLSEAGTYRYYRFTGTTWIESYNLLDSTGSPISGGDSPAAIGWPDANAAGFAASEKRTVAILPDSSGNLRVYVLNYDTPWDWAQVSLGSLGTTEGKPFMAYRHQRQADGAPRTDFPGQFMFGRMAPCDGGHCAYVRFTAQTSRTNPPGAAMTTTYVADYLQNVWAITQPGTSAALYGDSTLDNVFGLSPHSVKLTSEYGLNFYPHADGSPEHAYGIRSDFRVMEDGICSVIGGDRAFACGGVNVLD
ncbi:MAG: hypothetical protein CVU56_15795 [Deltaproteobacteria bacterium HGW-Deltaproteobacteria-14]|nr:MAG: hypothetical protein CVU56_15795 [Deltaproteobacteria bacterium HGW-Deltaproteobacteria-14]